MHIPRSGCVIVKEQQNILNRIIFIVDYVPVLCSVLLSTYHSGDQITKREMGGYVTCTGTGEIHVRSLWGDLTEREHVGELGIDRWIILKWIF